MKFKLTESIKKQSSINSIGLWAIRCQRYRGGKIVTVKKDRYGLYWDEEWQKARVNDEEELECWKLEE
jgi:hypothetical protein